MLYDTHVYLGPTLQASKAKHYLWQAHYHPPIQCGDLIRLLRLNPKRILIIDGVYENVPAIWHKEIMLAMEHKVSVYGAASMGALRAAELYAFGMVGIGEIFQFFKNKTLGDDDEVAVLHQGMESQYQSLNETMVNIRATSEQAYSANILTTKEKNNIIAYCKSQFYPYRSVEKAARELNIKNLQPFCRWVREHGQVDVKEKDAINALTYVQSLISADQEEKKTSNTSMPVTKFIASLVDDMEVTAFAFQMNWLPDIEKKLHILSLERPKVFHLLGELAKLMKQANQMHSLSMESLPPIQTSLDYIKQHNLYFPDWDATDLEGYPKRFALFSWIAHHVCSHHLTHQLVEAYLPAMAIYFNISDEDSSIDETLLSFIFLLIHSCHVQLNDRRLKIKQSVIARHLRSSGFWARYQQMENKQAIVLHTAIDFIAIYMQVTYLYQGFRDIQLGSPELPSYFQWLYDAYFFYELSEKDFHGATK
jgi:hypothetical protein